MKPVVAVLCLFAWFVQPVLSAEEASPGSILLRNVQLIERIEIPIR